MANEQSVEMFFDVLNMYHSGMYTQEDIAENLNIPLNAVAFCTQYAGNWHTKARNGRRGVYYTDNPIFDQFEKMLNKKEKFAK